MLVTSGMIPRFCQYLFVFARLEKVYGTVETLCYHNLCYEQIELQAKLLNYFLGSNKSNISQSQSWQDSAITILAGLQHDSVAVRANYENLLEHARGRSFPFSSRPNR